MSKKLSSLCVSRAAPALELFWLFFFPLSGNWLLPWIRPHLLTFLQQPPGRARARRGGWCYVAANTERLVASLNAPPKPGRHSPRRLIKAFASPACTCNLNIGKRCFSICLGPRLRHVQPFSQRIQIPFSQECFIVSKMFSGCGAKKQAKKKNFYQTSVPDSK